MASVFRENKFLVKISPCVVMPHVQKVAAEASADALPVSPLGCSRVGEGAGVSVRQQSSA